MADMAGMYPRIASRCYYLQQYVCDNRHVCKMHHAVCGILDTYRSSVQVPEPAGRQNTNAAENDKE